MNKQFLILVGIILIATAIPLTVFLAQQQQQPSSKAAVPGGQIIASLDPETATVNTGVEFRVGIRLDTNGLDASAAKFYLYYNYTGNQPELDVLDQDATASGIQVEQNQASFTYSKNEVEQNTTTKTVSIRVWVWAMPEYIRTQPGSPITVATIHFRGTRPVTGLRLRFDSSNQYAENVVTVMSGANAEDQLNIPNDGIYNITPPPPSVTNISPTSAQNTATTNIMISGSNFNNPSTTLTRGSETINGTITSSDSTQIVANFNITNRNAGSWTLTVTNADGQRDNHLTFQITLPTTITFKVRFQGIKSGTSSMSAQVVDFQLRSIASGTTILPTTKVTTAAERVGGVYTNAYLGTLTLPNLTSTSGSYEALIKGPKHLAKKFTLASLTPNQNNSFTWTTDAEVLRVGDIYGPGTNHSPDNLVDIWDYTILLAETKNPSAGIRADFDNNGLVDIWDYTYLRANIGVTGE